MLRRSLTLLIAVHALAGAEPAAEAFPAVESGEWPQYGYDAGCTFSTQGTLAMPLAPKWTFKRAAPVVEIGYTAACNDKVYLSCVGDHNHSGANTPANNNPYLIGLDLATGKQVWQWNGTFDWCKGCPIAVTDKHLLVNDDGFNIVLFASGAKQKMTEADHWGQISMDKAANLVVYVSTLKVDNAGTFFGGRTVDDHALWYGLLDDGVRMEDKMTAAAIAQGNGKVFVTLALAGPSPKKHKDGLYALDQKTGIEQWHLEGLWGGISFDGTYVYSVGNLGGKDPKPKLYCLDPGKGEVVWSMNVGESVHHPPAHGRGVCVLVTDSGHLLAFPTTGDKAGKKLLWQGATEALRVTDVALPPAVLAIAQAAGKNGVVVVANGKDVQMIDLQKGASVAKMGWDSSLGPAREPMIVNGQLIVHGANGVACFGANQKKKAAK
jgi:outer membrane protein assembly factor BamB